MHDSPPLLTPVAALPDHPRLATSPLVVLALCADWCGTCRDFRQMLDRLARARPEIVFAWADIPRPDGTYAPGTDIRWRITLRDGQGNRLHPEGSLPTYNEVVFGANEPGIQYYRAVFDPSTTYYAVSTVSACS